MLHFEFRNSNFENGERVESEELRVEIGSKSLEVLDVPGVAEVYLITSPTRGRAESINSDT